MSLRPSSDSPEQGRSAARVPHERLERAAIVDPVTPAQELTGRLDPLWEKVLASRNPRDIYWRAIAVETSLLRFANLADEGWASEQTLRCIAAELGFPSETITPTFNSLQKLGRCQHRKGPDGVQVAPLDFEWQLASLEQAMQALEVLQGALGR